VTYWVAKYLCHTLSPHGEMKKSKTTQLDELARKINEGYTGSPRPWQGARVIITDVAPEPAPPGLSPNRPPWSLPASAN